MNDVLSNWQYSLNQQLVNRLNRPLHQPGMMRMAMSQRIINRCDRLLNRLPLLSQQMQRWGNTNTTTPDAVPIIYAQPISLTNQRETESREQNFQSNVSENQPSVPLIQRKIDSSQPLAIRPVNSTVINQNNNYLSNSNFPHNINSDLTLEIPVVSSQPISEKSLETEEMPLQTQFNESKISLSNPSQLNTNISSTFTKDEITTINQNAISSLQPISEEMTLVEKSISTYIQQLPIVQSKQQTASLSISPSSLPVAYPLNTLTSVKQIQPINSSEQINSITQENLESRISSPNFNIVTAHPLTDKVNSTEEQISFNRNSSHSQNQYFNTSNSQTNQTTPFPVEDYRSRSVSLQGENKNRRDAENTEERGKERLVVLERDWSNYNQNISDLPIVTIASPMNYTSKPQSLPLAKSTSLSNSINHHQPRISKVSNTNSSSSPKIFASASSPTEVSVSTITNQSNSTIDLDTIANQVERKLMRRLVIESERRGKIR